LDSVLSEPQWRQVAYNQIEACAEWLKTQAINCEGAGWKAAITQRLERYAEALLLIRKSAGRV
jgi:hypothetical protein